MSWQRTINSLFSLGLFLVLNTSMFNQTIGDGVTGHLRDCSSIFLLLTSVFWYFQSCNSDFSLHRKRVVSSLFICIFHID